MTNRLSAFRGGFAVGSEDFVGVLVFERDAGGHQVPGVVFVKWMREIIIPTEGGK